MKKAWFIGLCFFALMAVAGDYVLVRGTLDPAPAPGDVKWVETGGPTSAWKEARGGLVVARDAATYNDTFNFILLETPEPRPDLRPFDSGTVYLFAFCGQDSPEGAVTNVRVKGDTVVVTVDIQPGVARKSPWRLAKVPKDSLGTADKFALVEQRHSFSRALKFPQVATGQAK